jgi:hypothetical protein
MGFTMKTAGVFLPLLKPSLGTKARMAHAAARLKASGMAIIGTARVLGKRSSSYSTQLGPQQQPRSRQSAAICLFDARGERA